MAKVNLGFDIDNKATHVADKFAWGNDLPTGQTWGDLILSDMTEARQYDARDALEIWGYI